jgi:hypothetical protein
MSSSAWIAASASALPPVAELGEDVDGVLEAADLDALEPLVDLVGRARKAAQIAVERPCVLLDGAACSRAFWLGSSASCALDARDLAQFCAASPSISRSRGRI